MIDTPDGLQTLVDRALDAPFVAIDTEFVWEKTYYPWLGIVQVGLADDDCHLIDAVALKDLSPLGAVLSSPDTVKILHDAQQDLWILRLATGALPRNVFDTRCAAGFAGLGSTMSLSNLLRACLDVQLAKTETRTDWLKRPLSDNQLDYALDDVRYLPALRDHLLRAIHKLDREPWLAEELARYDVEALYNDRVPETQYARVKGTGRLSRRDMAVLRELACWREIEAQKVNLPRNRVLSDDAMVQISRRKPHSVRSLNRLRGILDETVEAYGDIILGAVRNGLVVEEKDCPPVSPPTRPNPFEDARLDFAMAFLRGRCLSDGIDIAMVASRANVKALVSEGSKINGNPLDTGWRHEFLGQDLTALLGGAHAIGIDPETHLPGLLRDEVGAD